MKYKSEIAVPITLSGHVETIAFDDHILVSLDCSICRRSRRTVVFGEERDTSFCTPAKHGFPGRIAGIHVSDHESAGSHRERSVVTATYLIEYEFEAFKDRQYPDRNIGPAPTWARAAFTLLCKCGAESAHETQNNLVRPVKAVCECGEDLYYEVDEIPIFRNTERA